MLDINFFHLFLDLFIFPISLKLECTFKRLDITVLEIVVSQSSICGLLILYSFHFNNRVLPYFYSMLASECETWAAG